MGALDSQHFWPTRRVQWYNTGAETIASGVPAQGRLWNPSPIYSWSTSFRFSRLLKLDKSCYAVGNVCNSTETSRKMVHPLLYSINSVVLD